MRAMRGLRVPAHRMRWFINILMVVGALALGQQVVTGSPMLRISAAVGLMVMMGVPALERPKTAMVALFAWLPFLGFVRRALIPTAGWSSLDPLLLVSSAVAILVFLTLMISKRAELGGTGLAKIFFAFSLVVLIQLFNPEQGSPLVALTGVMFIVVPMLAFVIARTLADDEYTKKIQYVVLITGVITAVWGLKQVYIGFTGFERDWLECCAYGALRINKTIRPFSTFTNSLEFAGYMGFGVAVCVARMLYAKGYARFLLGGCGVLMAWAGFLVGSRATVIVTILAIFLLVGLRARSRMASAGIFILLAGLAVLWAASNRSDPNTSLTAQQGVEQLKAQQLVGLTNPFDSRVSTLPGHITRVEDGLLYSWHNPAGLGTGSITRGGQKFRQGASTGTELDFGNAFLAYGLIGGAMYVLLALRVFWQLYVLRRKTLSPVWAAVLAMAIISLGQWQNGGAYALSSMIWFMIGCADRAYMQLPRRARYAHPNVAQAEAAA